MDYVIAITAFISIVLVFLSKYKGISLKYSILFMSIAILLNIISRIVNRRKGIEINKKIKSDMIYVKNRKQK